MRKIFRIEGKVNRHKKPHGLGWAGIGVGQKVKVLEGVLVRPINLKGKVF